MTAHHWIITAQAENGNALGTCKLCGETRIFPNTLPDDAKERNKRFGAYMFRTKKRKRKEGK